ncbi:MAG: HAMP domain-containing histidine kinase [Anaerolineales bacterium]|jgi:two-component system OmpR family sensor kinase|nr:HAMP domain-containing histidine kinase [Anaerolineales bacterium]
MKIRWEWIAPFFPTLLAMIIVTVLDAVGIIDFSSSIHDPGTLIILTGLILTIIASSILLSQEAVRQMRVTSLRQAQQDYDGERSRFLRRLDHELKNPLTGIKLAVANLVTIEDPEARETIRDNIHLQVMRMSRIVTDLRKIADLSTQKLEESAVNLEDLLGDVYAQVHEETPANERDLQLNLPEPPQGLPNIMGDQDLLLVAIYNLLNNALKYTRAGDTVALRAYAQDETVVIEVTDTGIGISSADLPYIWDELYRSERVRDIPGSGIGLALVKLIIERHGGEIEVQSQIDQGTTVRVCLPAMLVADPVTRLVQSVSNS